jgi:hypothetical protein
MTRRRISFEIFSDLFHPAARGAHWVADLTWLDIGAPVHHRRLARRADAEIVHRYIETNPFAQRKRRKGNTNPR